MSTHYDHMHTDALSDTNAAQIVFNLASTAGVANGKSLLIDSEVT
jgi:hypothetical protein